MQERSLGDPVDIYPGAKSRLLDYCERAKIDLSSRSNVRIYVDSFFKGIEDEGFDSPLSQGELEQIVNPLLDKAFERIRRILDDAGCLPEQIALCVATGGMSNMPAVKRRLHELFGPEQVEIPDSTTTLIAGGAAWIAADEVDLQLAKRIELELARNSYLQVVKAGTTMPKQGKEQTQTLHLYCTDPRDGTAKLQLCAPKSPGSSVLRSEPRVHLENVTVKVDSRAQAFDERLELDVQINDDLILTAHARSLNLKDEDSCEIHDLEFGLKFPYHDKESVESAGGDGNDVPGLKEPEAVGQPLGTISVRANVSDRKDPSLVPGEFLYQYDPGYFDSRRQPPEKQVQERLYYEPCAVCGRASNDPACDDG